MNTVYKNIFLLLLGTTSPLWAGPLYSRTPRIQENPPEEQVSQEGNPQEERKDLYPKNQKNGDGKDLLTEIELPKGERDLPEETHISKDEAEKAINEAVKEGTEGKNVTPEEKGKIREILETAFTTGVGLSLGYLAYQYSPEVRDVLSASALSLINTSVEFGLEIGPKAAMALGSLLGYGEYQSLKIGYDLGKKGFIPAMKTFGYDLGTLGGAIGGDLARDIASFSIMKYALQGAHTLGQGTLWGVDTVVQGAKSGISAALHPVKTFHTAVDTVKKGTSWVGDGVRSVGNSLWEGASSIKNGATRGLSWAGNTLRGNVDNTAVEPGESISEEEGEKGIN